MKAMVREAKSMRKERQNLWPTTPPPPLYKPLGGEHRRAGLPHHYGRSLHGFINDTGTDPRAQ